MTEQYWCGTCQENREYFAKFAGLQFTADEIRVALFDLTCEMIDLGLINYFDDIDPRVVLDALYERKMNR